MTWLRSGNRAVYRIDDVTNNTLGMQGSCRGFAGALDDPRNWPGNEFFADYFSSAITSAWGEAAVVRLPLRNLPAGTHHLINRRGRGDARHRTVGTRVHAGQLHLLRGPGIPDRRGDAGGGAIRPADRTGGSATGDARRLRTERLLHRRARPADAREHRLRRFHDRPRTTPSSIGTGSASADADGPSPGDDVVAHREDGAEDAGRFPDPGDDRKGQSDDPAGNDVSRRTHVGRRLRPRSPGGGQGLLPRRRALERRRQSARVSGHVSATILWEPGALPERPAQSESRVRDLPASLRKVTRVAPGIKLPERR